MSGCANSAKEDKLVTSSTITTEAVKLFLFQTSLCPKLLKYHSEIITVVCIFHNYAPRNLTYLSIIL